MIQQTRPQSVSTAPLVWVAMFLSHCAMAAIAAVIGREFANDFSIRYLPLWSRPFAGGPAVTALSVSVFALALLFIVHLAGGWDDRARLCARLLVASSAAQVLLVIGLWLSVANFEPLPGVSWRQADGIALRREIPQCATAIALTMSAWVLARRPSAETSDGLDWPGTDQKTTFGP